MWRRVAQVAGLTLAGLSGLSYLVVAALSSGEARVARPSLAASPGQPPSFTAVIAGRDIKYCKPGYGPGRIRAVPCEGENRFSTRTDTIMFVSLRGGRLDVVSIPRDTVVDGANGPHRVNTSLEYGGGEALARAVESLVGVKVDYHAVVNVEFVERAVDALGGVDVYLPEPMDYDDYAAGLHVHLPAGNQHLGGAEAVGYLRVRKGYGDDYARMDRAKGVLGKLLDKARGPAAIAALPTVIGGLAGEIETNLDLESVRRLVPALGGLGPRFSTLPTREPGPRERYRYGFLGSVLVADGEAIAREIAPNLADPVAPLEAPSTPITILNASGVPGLARALAAHLVRLGLPEPVVASAPVADEATQVMRQRWADPAVADYYAGLLDIPVFTPNSPPVAGVVVYLGRDAATRYAALADQAAAADR